MAVQRITDDTTEAELAEYLRNMCAYAKRQQCIVGNLNEETAWDKAHRRMDGALDDWLRAHQGEPCA